MAEYDFDRTYKRGEKGPRIKLIQEWLSLHGFRIKLDGDFGPASESAVKQFRTRRGLPAGGEVDEPTFLALVAPMKAALAPIAGQGKGLGELFVAYAQQHLAQHPREIGGQNRGPWVRLYMLGNEGDPWAWCAGFVCFCLGQACTALGLPLPIKSSFSCDALAASAKENQRFFEVKRPGDYRKLEPGSIFLVRRTPTDWIHTGIVVQAEKEFFHTIEGNTNDDGSREGYEVCARTRGYGKVDFILVG